MADKTVTVGDTEVEIRETEDGFEAVEVEDAEPPNVDLFDGDMQYAFFGSGTYNVVLDEETDFEVDGDTVYFDKEDVVHVGDAWEVAERRDIDYSHGLHFSYMGSTKDESRAKKQVQ